MVDTITSDQVWTELEKQLFAYGVGVSLMTMRHPEKAYGRAPVE